ncbi:MAG: hypothetical protein HWN69_03745 [Desulfobacterales bacterium]|nr:hypothetical protein [Desulfobacterales bacterium]
MSADEQGKNDSTSAGDVSGVETEEPEEIIELVDEVTPDDESGQPEQAEEIESKTEEGGEDLLEEEGPPESQSADTAPDEVRVEDILEAEAEQPVEPADEADSEVDFALEEEAVEPGGLAEEPGPDADESELPELSENDITAIPEPDEGDNLVDTLGIEISEEGPADEDLAVPEDPGEAPLSEGAPEQAILERFPDEKLEEIITNIVKQRVDEKVERILLEAAEAAIAREIDKVKQAL